MLYTGKRKEKLIKGAEMINKVNALYLKGDKAKAEKIKGKLKKIKGVEVLHMVQKSRTIREG